MRAATIETIGFPGPGWRYASRNANRQLGFLPNKQAHNTISNRGLMLADISSHGEDYPISVRALEYIVQRDREHAIKKGYYGLIDRNGLLINTILCCTLYERLKRIPQQKGNGSADGSPAFGNYWWVNANFEPVDSNGNLF